MPEALTFYPGLHQPADCKNLPKAFVSVNRLKTRKSDFVVGDWIMDSGAFTELNGHGQFRTTPGEYADMIVRWSRCGNLIAACTQDYMCEPFMFAGQEKTPEEIEEWKEELLFEGANPIWFELYPWEFEEGPEKIGVADHQWLTVYRYKWLLEELAARKCDTYVMPVLQGYLPDEYVNCIDLYEKEGLLPHGSYVGVGSVCKRNVNPETVVTVLSAIKRRRPDLQLHGFGIKITALSDPKVRALLHSADSMAWSVDARHTRNRIRKNGGDWRAAPSPNDWRVAKAYADRVDRIINSSNVQ
jgi:hypothetical protein